MLNTASQIWRWSQFRKLHVTPCIDQVWNTYSFSHWVKNTPQRYQPTGIYLVIVNNGKTRTMCQICSKWKKRHQNEIYDIVLVFLLLTLNMFHLLFWCFHCWFWAIICRLGICCTLYWLSLIQSQFLTVLEIY